MSHWTLLSNHGHVLLFLARNPEARLRDVAAAVGITERAVQKIVRDLQNGDILAVTKHGRRNRYRINTRKPLRHALEAHRTVGNLVSLVGSEKRPRKRKRAARPVAVPEAGPPEPAPQREKEPDPGPDAPVSPAPIEPAPPEELQAQETAAGQAPAQREVDRAKAPAGARRRVKKKTPTDDQQGSLF